MRPLLPGLMLAQALALSAAPLLILVGGLAGAQLNPDPRFATLPVAAMICGTALAAFPAARLAALLGRRRLFLLAMALGAFASAGAATSVALGWFWGFVASTLLTGMVNAVVQQFRFVAMASVAPERQAVVASRLLLVGLVSAFMGPELVRLLTWFPDTGFAPAFAALAALYLLALPVLWWVMPAGTNTQQTAAGEGRGWAELLAQPPLQLAIASAACGFGVMAYVMTATPLSMTQGMGYALSDAKWVIQSHIAAMFLPSLVTGQLIRRFGHWNMIASGLAVMVVCLAFAWWDQTLLHYWGGLILLGLGWNLLFVSGTSLLTRGYRAEEATRVQGMNDALVFTAQAFGALASGAVVLLFGWQGLLLTAVPALVILALVLIRTRVTGGASALR
ncbi:MFS transporter [Thalassolituus sp. LLYu03]|uniref:MFS transporter n=1 Tax=Thalassolituus sp. LLYu03 TaxID=3421656 RepID=UPI003D293C1F